jgi:hypothetical protein
MTVLWMPLLAQDANWRPLSAQERERLQRTTANSAMLQVSLKFDRERLFPGEETAVTLRVSNPTDKTLEVFDPFKKTTSRIMFPADSSHEGPQARVFPTIFMSPSQSISISIRLNGDCRDAPVSFSSCMTPTAPYAKLTVVWIYARVIAAETQIEILSPNLVNAVEVISSAARQTRAAGREDPTPVTRRIYQRAFLLERDHEYWVCSSATGATHPLAEDARNRQSVLLGRILCHHSSRQMIEDLTLVDEGDGTMSIHFRDEGKQELIRLGPDRRRFR